eukprot:11923053-Alexandrium_andersonii.AAC.1
MDVLAMLRRYQPLAERARSCIKTHESAQHDHTCLTQLKCSRALHTTALDVSRPSLGAVRSKL